MSMYEKQQGLVEQVLTNMQVCQDMLGARDGSKEGAYGFVPGLGETGKAKALGERMEGIRKGIFQVMFTGCFNAGKSTLLNALMRSELLATGNLPETAVITKIIFNTEEEKAVIFKRDQVDEKGKPATEVMPDIGEFFKKYRVDPEDKAKFLRLVDHVELYQKRAGLAGSMVQLVDSPGTRASMEDDEVSLNFIRRADAVVFLISALQPLDKEDKDYIKNNFANRQMKNVFFVVNKINLLNTQEEVSRLEDYVRQELRDVFVDQNGRFDGELYAARVFYVNAFGSMNTRVGKETPITLYYKVMIPDNSTGVPEFEAALGRFLTSGDKDRSALAAYRPQMANMYAAAESAAKSQLNILRQGAEASEQKMAAYRKDKERIQREIEDIRDDIDHTTTVILNDAKEVYEDFVTAVDTEWETYFSEKSSEMGIHYWKMLGAQAKRWTAFWKSKEVKEAEFQKMTEESTREFSEGIKGFIGIKQAEMSESFEKKVRIRVSELSQRLERHQRSLENMNVPVDVDEILRGIAQEQDIKVKGSGENRANLGQAFIAILFADPELVTTAAGGDKGMVDFIVDVIKTNVVDVIVMGVLAAILGNVVALIGFVLVKLFKNNARSENMTEKIIAGTKETILDGYQDKDGNFVPGLRGEGERKYINKTKAVVGGTMLRSSTKLIDSIRGRLEIYERELESAVRMLRQNKDVLDKERQRVGQILDRMAAAISEISRITSGVSLTKEEILKLAAEGMEKEKNHER